MWRKKYANRFNVFVIIHPLALWCGNNEIELGIVGWNWPETFSYSDELYERLKADYRELFQRLIPKWLSEEDPYHAYLASSPIGIGRMKRTTKEATRITGASGMAASRSQNMRDVFRAS